MRFWEESRPDLLEPLSLALRLGFLVEAAEEVETGTRPLVVNTSVCVLLPLTVTTVVTNCCGRLLTDFDWPWVTSDASVERGSEDEVMVDRRGPEVESRVTDVVTSSSVCEVECGTEVTEGEGLPFAESLVVCKATVGDAGAGVLGDDEVGLAEGGAELVAAGDVEAGAVAEAPVPTGTFCRY